MQPLAILVSERSNEPELQALIEHFVCRLVHKAERMSELLKSRRYDEIALLAHQLTGSGGGYGYPTLSESARLVEQGAKAELDPEQLEKIISDLTELCYQAMRGLPPGACDFDTSGIPE